nr:hypothetical protein [Tanacetum cinerariifolium]
MALGAKLKLGFIDGTSPKPAVIHNDYQRWVHCDYMVTCWILNSMVTELSESFLYAQSASDLWKELEERYGQSNGPFIYHVEKELSKVSQVRNQILSMYPLQNLNKAYYIVQQVEKQKQVTHQVADPTAFFANNKGNQNGYPDWYKGKKNKKGNRMASQVVSNFNTYMTKETPFDFESENESIRILKKPIRIKLPDGTSKWVDKDPSTEKVLVVGEGHNNLYICKPSSSSSTKHFSFPTPTFPVMSSFANKEVHYKNVTLDLFHARLGHTSVSQLVHVDSSTYLINKMPMKILDWKTPFEMLHGMPPSYDHLRVICYKLYDLETHEVFSSRYVFFQENVFPFKKDCVSFGVPSSTQQWPLEDVASDEDSAPYSVPDISSDHVVLNTPFDHDISNISFDIPKPNIYSQAANDPKWVEAMRKELQALRTNDTWVLTELPDGHKAIYSKWVYKIRYFADGTVERYQARLVIRGFDQKEGVDYKHTFSLVAKAATVRVLIAITTAKGWPLHQLDINNAFLRGFVDEKIYMKPPEGYTKATQGQVCKLNKSLYGLKQTSKKWNQELLKFLVTLGFIQSKHDYLLFVKTQGALFTVALVYVDDILLTGNSIQDIKDIKLALDNKFTIKDLGLVRYFLGIELCNTKNETFLHQRKEPHLQAATHLLRYLNGSINKGLFYPVQSNLKVIGFSYADWASCIMTRKSLTGYCIFLGHSLVS